MDIFKIVIWGITAGMILLLIRRERPELAMGFSLVAGVSILLAVLPGLRTVVSAFSDIASEAGLTLTGIILKVVAISYMPDLGLICRMLTKTYRFPD